MSISTIKKPSAFAVIISWILAGFGIFFGGIGSFAFIADIFSGKFSLNLLIGIVILGYIPAFFSYKLFKNIKLQKDKYNISILESNLLKFAYEIKEPFTIAQAAAKLNFSIETVKQGVELLVVNGSADVDVNDEGETFFRIKGLK